MLKGLQKLLNSDGGRYIISILLGLGLSTLFRNACNDRKCLVFKAVTPDQVKDKIFKVGDDCYKYTSHQVKCSDDKKRELTFN